MLQKDLFSLKDMTEENGLVEPVEYTDDVEDNINKMTLNLQGVDVSTYGWVTVEVLSKQYGVLPSLVVKVLDKLIKEYKPVDLDSVIKEIKGD